MMKRKLMTLMVTGAALLTAGCALRPNKEDIQITSPAVSNNNPETAAASTEASTEEESSSVNVIDLGVSSPSQTDSEEQGEHVPETVPIEDLEEPLDEDGVWTDYILATDTKDDEWEAPLFGVNGSKFVVQNYPVIFVTGDSEKEAEINSIVDQYVVNQYSDRFQIMDIDIELTCSVLNESRFVCYQLEGTVKHIGDDVRYEDEREYRYYFTIDRMTGQIINLETAIGEDVVYEEISSGDYEIVRGDAAVFEQFSNDLLADVYFNEPLFSDDTEHELDYYIQDGHVYVVIWVGEQNGSYVILRLNKESAIQ